MTDFKKKLGKRIRHIRKSRSITQEKLAELIGIEIPSISYIETGKFAPSCETLQKMCRVLDVQPWEFYYFEALPMEEMLDKIVTKLREDDKLTNNVYHFVSALSM